MLSVTRPIHSKGQTTRLVSIDRTSRKRFITELYISKWLTAIPTHFHDLETSFRELRNRKRHQKQSAECGFCPAAGSQSPRLSVSARRASACRSPSDSLGQIASNRRSASSFSEIGTVNSDSCASGHGHIAPDFAALVRRIAVFPRETWASSVPTGGIRLSGEDLRRFAPSRTLWFSTGFSAFWGRGCDDSRRLAAPCCTRFCIGF
jgi:hypothetical protein